MAQVVGVKFRNSAKVYYFSPEGLNDLEPGDYVIVETARGQAAGLITFSPREVPDKEIPGQLKGILRQATAMDLTDMERYQQREKHALYLCRAKVSESGLPMKVIRAEYSFDGSYLTFFFAADKRVDFRALVKDLAHTFKSRIELRQVGVRDEVKLLGGYGVCGRPHCCATWMSDFNPISIRMAKQQDLPLSPMEISGVCGRLLCCLAYENDFYGEMKKRLPQLGSQIETPQGMGQVVALNVLDESVDIKLEDETLYRSSLSDLESSRSESQLKSHSRRRRR